MSRINIDLMGDHLPSLAEIDTMVEDEIRAAYASSLETKILRQYLATPTDALIKANFVAYNTFVEACRSQAVVVRTSRLALESAMAYEAATKRLAQYIKATGVPAHTIQIPTGAKVLDKASGLMVDVFTQQDIPAIAPLPATVPIADMSGALIQVPNPELIQDATERADAQSIVDFVTADVAALVAKRVTR